MPRGKAEAADGEGSSRARIVNDALAIGLLEQRLRDPNRQRPVVLVTIDAGQRQPYVPVSELERKVRRRADIVIVPHELTRSLSDRLGKRESAFQGACRVYPAGDAWTRDLRLSPLRLGDTPEHRERLLALLVGDLDALTTQSRGRSAAEVAPKGSTLTSSPLSGATPGSTGVFHVHSEALAEELARHLLDPDRERPVVVVTSAARLAEPYVDPAALADNLRGLADVWQLPTGVISWAFARHLPAMCEVYGGAARVYPPGTGWTDDPYSAPLRFAYGPADGPAVLEQVTADAMRVVRAEATFVRARTAVEVEGTVIGIAAGRGLVNLTRGASGMASIWPELVVSGVAVESVLRDGMTVRGPLDLESRRLDVSPMKTPVADALAGYQVGAVVLGLTKSVERTLCVVELFPDFPVAIEPDDVLSSSRQVDLRTLITEGEVLVARVVERGDLPEDWRLTLIDVGPDDQPLPAPAILRGGPAWLVPPPEEADETENAVVVPAEPIPAPPPPPPSLPAPDADVHPEQEALRSLVVERDNLLGELQRQRAASRRDAQELTALRTAVRKATRAQESAEAKLSATQAELGRSAHDEALFGDPLEQLRFEVNLAWARRIPAEQKKDLPLAPWTVGPEFFASWDAVEGVARAKVVDVIVEVLTGLVFHVASREAHQLRTGTGGDDPFVSRTDGATCWRVSLQIKTPSARRLHFWQRNDGSIELASVRLHDDVRL